MADLVEWEVAVDELGMAIGFATAEAFDAVTGVLRTSMHPQHEVSGKLRDSIEMEGPTEQLGGYYASYGPTLVYTRIVEQGHKKDAGRPSYRKPQPWFREGFSREAAGLQQTVFVPRWADVLRGG